LISRLQPDVLSDRIEAMMEQRDGDKILLETALRALGEEAVAAGKIIDIAVYRGSSLVLVSNFRVSTKDVDAVTQGDERFLRVAAERVGQRLGLPGEWLNDGVKTYLAPNDEASRHSSAPIPTRHVLD
jgi:hypothetical protein